MACPACACKVHYQYDDGDDCGPHTEGLERCAACGHVFDIEDAADGEDDAYGVQASGLPPQWEALIEEAVDAFAEGATLSDRLPNAMAALRHALAYGVPEAPRMERVTGTLPNREPTYRFAKPTADGGATPWKEVK